MSEAYLAQAGHEAEGCAEMDIKMGEIKVGRMVLGMCQTNCYFLYREGEKQTIVVDPADKGANIYNALEKNGFLVAGILLTHGHFDHIWGLEELKTAANLAAQTAGREPVKVYAGEAERLLLNSPELNVSERAGRACGVTADVYVEDGDEITLAGLTLSGDYHTGTYGGRLLLLF